ncbi:MAG: hypothetical protein ACRDBQ_18635 [Shewanella sp.]
MGIGNVLSQLLPSYEAVNLRDNLNANILTIQDKILPVYRNMAVLVGAHDGKPFLDKNVAEFNETIVKHMEMSGLKVKSLRSPSMLDYIIPMLENVVAMRGFLLEAIQRDVGKQVVTTSMSFNKATLLQLLDMISFVSSYAPLMINFITASELAAVKDSNLVAGSIGPNDLVNLQQRIQLFCIACRVLGTPINKLKADYAEIPDMIFDEDSYNALSTNLGLKTVDPLGLSGAPFPMSLVFRVRMLFAEKQMDNLDEIDETIKASELRIMLYKKQQTEGSGDAYIEEIIEGHEKRVSQLKRDRERLEKKYDLK